MVLLEAELLRVGIVHQLKKCPENGNLIFSCSSMSTFMEDNILKVVREPSHFRCVKV